MQAQLQTSQHFKQRCATFTAQKPGLKNLISPHFLHEKLKSQIVSQD